MRVAIKTLGCRLNQAESDKIRDTLRDKGFQIVASKERADLYIINTCSITHTADTKSRQAARMIRHSYPGADIIATGCSPAIKDEVDLYLTNKDAIPDTIIEKYGRNLKEKAGSEESRKTRAFIKVQDGCDNFCSYCIIPYRRGGLLSRYEKDILDDIKRKEQEGYKEIVLSGVNILKFGKDINKSDVLVELIEKVLKVTSIPRIRFGSIDPSLVDDNFIKLFNNERLLNHLHLSLQSGSNAVLKRMKRPYTKEGYEEVVKKLRSLDRDFNITTDVICGFPGETDGEFKETVDFLRLINLAKIHYFRYSLRPGTAAATFSSQISEIIKKKRADTLHALNIDLQKKAYEKIIGRKATVLVEAKGSKEWMGYTDNFMRVKILSSDNLANSIIQVKIQEENIPTIL